jgi:carboxyl-terminal processing protease
VVPLSYGAQMKITVAKYYIPSGRCIQAIDYFHRNKDGQAGQFPDSLIRAFKTKHGRTVYDGRGITPDFIAPSKEFSNISLTLYSKFLIFDFATQYRLQHPEIGPADQFNVSDSVYGNFMQYLADKNYDYTTSSEKQLESLKAAAEKEHYFESIELFYNKLKDVMLKDKQEDLKTYQEQIRDIIRLEIVSRYYFQKGKVVASLHTDTDIAAAKRILNDPATYASILNGTYIQPDHTKLIKEDDAKFLEESPDE